MRSLDELSAHLDALRAKALTVAPEGAPAIWRTEWVRLMAPLTTGYLDAEGMGDRLVDAYLAATPPGPNPCAEAGQFLDFVRRIAAPLAHLVDVIDLERALLGPAGSAGRVGSVVCFSADPSEVLWALIDGDELPAVGSGGGVVVAHDGMLR